ncbi:MAG: hypothetical protein Q4C67_10335, partial [Deinococcus sp.]|nr:hypothetical protein [Deinococcus sp.]
MTQENSTLPVPAAIWPPTEEGLAGEPQDPVLRAIHQALQPLTPLLRSLTFTSGARRPSAQLTLGAEPYLVGVLVHDEDTLLVDVPVGEVQHTAENMHALLSLNLSRDWPFRVDYVGVGDGELEPQALVAIEYRLPLSELEQLPARVLEGWRKKRMADGVV